jgi:hypothetical protein
MHHFFTLFWSPELTGMLPSFLICGVQELIFEIQTILAKMI